jgi:hypothetical protein
MKFLTQHLSDIFEIWKGILGDEGNANDITHLALTPSYTYKTNGS